jgi:DNA-damage-inducible protein D
MIEPNNHLESRVALFQSREIRRTLHNDEWWFVITDIVAALTDAADPSDYWKKMRRRDPDLSLDSQGGGQIDPPLALAFDKAGGRQKLQCWNTQGIFRLIQSIPSPKAEPFKRWLAKVGKERLDEIENPELAMGRMQELYEKKGYPKEWIDKRLRGIAVRQDLTDEWKQRGVTNSQEFAILTNEIMPNSSKPPADRAAQPKTASTRRRATMWPR